MDDYLGFRRALWLGTDRAYKTAEDAIARKRSTLPSELTRKLVACEICRSTPEDNTRGYPSKIPESFDDALLPLSLVHRLRLNRKHRPTGDCLVKSGSRSGIFKFLSVDRLRAMASSAVL